MKEKIKSMINYGGLTKSEYTLVSPKIIKINRKMAMTFAIIATLLISIMLGLSYIQPEFSSSKNIYMAGIGGSLIILILAFLGKYKFQLTETAVHLAEIFFLAYGYFIGIFSRTDQQTTTFIVLMILLPLIFVDKPRNTIFIISAWNIAFCVSAYMKKAPDIRSVDITNALIFGLLSIISGTIIINMKMNEFLLEYKLNLLSTTDKLTGLNNRNCYEWMVETYPENCMDSICCVYIDVNGLHDLNNTKGHDAGDQMLKFIAKEVQNNFGTKDTYRIGGDEYIAFMIDATPKEITEKIKNLKINVEWHGYHVAIGCERQNKDVINMHRLIKRAEQRMYQNKEEYYEKYGIEHR